MTSRCGVCAGDRRRATGYLLACAVMLMACAGPPPAKVTTPMESGIEQDAWELWAVTKRPGVSVLVARTEAVGPSAGFWSGTFAATQKVTVEVERSICGPAASGRLELEVTLVAGSRLADATPQVAPWIGTTGKRVIWVLQDGKPVDEDLGAMAADAATELRMAELCTGPQPPGIAAVLQEVAAIAASDAAVKATVAAPLTGVIDVQDETGAAVARLTLYGGVVRAFTGVRYARVADSRGPDVTLRAAPAQLARAFAGETRLDDLVRSGAAPALLGAFSKAAAAIGKAPALAARIRDAGGR